VCCNHPVRPVLHVDVLRLLSPDARVAGHRR
jgi:hypothetical protein